jgi:EmrB/QacA subfamily drug resistance transporter
MADATRRSHPNVTFAVLALAGTAYSLLQSLVLPVLPTLEHELHTNQDTVTWVLTAYLLSASVATPILGRLGDMFGKERMLVITLTVLSVGTALAGAANTIGVLIVARVLQGIGGAIFPLAFGIIRDEFPAERVAGAIGFISSLLAVGGGLGIVLAGPITDHLSYHWLFWIPLLPVIASTVAAHVFIPESPVRTPGHLSVVGSVLLSGWLIALLLGVSEGPTWGWSSSSTVLLFLLAAVLFAAWIRAESRAREPLVDMRMMRLPAVWRTNLVALLFGFVMYASVAALPEFFQTPTSAGYGFGADVTQSGLFLLPQTVTMFFVGLYIGPITRRFGSKLAVLVGAVLVGASYLTLTWVHDQRSVIYVVSAVLGVGIGLGFSALSNLIVDAVPPEQTGVAAGMNANIRTIGGAIGGQVTASLIVAGAALGALPHESGYVHAFFTLGIFGMIAAIAAALIPTARRTSAEPLPDAGDLAAATS